jgi:curved DNA-binding protein CbpA
VPLRNRRNYYRLLQVQPDAPVEIIHASYRTLMRELKQHPDLGGSTSAAALLNEAYRVLSNPALRSEYDRELFARYPRQAVSGAEAPMQKSAAHLCHFCRTPLAGEPEPGQRCRTCQSPLRSHESAEVEELSRRTMARMARNDRITYKSRWPQEPREGRMIDLSPTGIRILCEEDISPGAILKISGAGLEATALVKYSRQSGGLCAVGAAFIAVHFENPRGSFFSTSA